MICAGIDAGSRTVKVVLLDSETLAVCASGITDQGVRQGEIAAHLLHEVCDRTGIRRNDIGRLIATGYGREAIDWAPKRVTEITCHACGVCHRNPQARTIVDIGGQDSKFLHLDESGNVNNFAMNDRCAAGTGRFLEVVAARLGLSISELGEFALRADRPSAISSMCVVFAETEIIGLLAAGESAENIAAGIQTSIAARIRAMAGPGVKDPVLFTGGVALIPGMDAVLGQVLGRPVQVASEPQLTGALGAAILAARSK